MSVSRPRLHAKRTRSRSAKVRRPNSRLNRQWQLVDRLWSEPAGLNFAEAIKLFGVCKRTIQRDLATLRWVGFDVEETVGDNGRRRWRIRHPFERLRSKRRKYQSIRNGLDLLLEHAEVIGDRRLIDGLKTIRKKVMRKCR